MGNRTIDEDGMNEKSGMIYSEYLAILSGNTELLEKARLEKKITVLGSERLVFTQGKFSTSSKLEDIKNRSKPIRDLSPAFPRM